MQRFTRVLSSRLDYSKMQVTYTPDESRFFGRGKNLNTPIGAPCQDKLKMAQILGSLVYICAQIEVIGGSLWPIA